MSIWLCSHARAVGLARSTRPGSELLPPPNQVVAQELFEPKRDRVADRLEQVALLIEVGPEYRGASPVAVVVEGVPQAEVETHVVDLVDHRLGVGELGGLVEDVVGVSGGPTVIEFDRVAGQIVVPSR
ncbi:MAG TPA: hypothetical protein VE442_23310 [Jatrophihabitans sp.]|nr:hypothetical protein [Jatrophihabitans sp.]